MSTYISVELRRIVYDHAKGRCEYCLIPQSSTLVSHEVDHVIAQKHGGLTEEHNLALSCSLCNKRKGSDLSSIDPETGSVTTLFHPRQEQWSKHFEFQGAVITPRTPEGRATIWLLQLNAPSVLQSETCLSKTGR
jgi:HNH endonuclease